MSSQFPFHNYIIEVYMACEYGLIFGSRTGLFVLSCSVLLGKWRNPPICWIERSMQLIPLPQGGKVAPPLLSWILGGITWHVLVLRIPFLATACGTVDWTIPLNIAVKMVTPENLSGDTGGRREPLRFDQDASATAVDMDTAIVLLGAGVTAITHPLLYVKLLIQVAS